MRKMLHLLQVFLAKCVSKLVALLKEVVGF